MYVDLSVDTSIILKSNYNKTQNFVKYDEFIKTDKKSSSRNHNFYDFLLSQKNDIIKYFFVLRLQVKVIKASINTML